MEKARKRIPRRITILYSSFIVSLVLCVGCMLAAHIIRDEAYRDLIQISSATNLQTRTDTYQRAIKLCPSRADAYLLLLEAYGEDGVFSKAESEAFLAIYNSNHSQLPNNDASAQVYAQAGLLYVNGYEENATISLRMALPFFEAALPLMQEDNPDYLTTSCYANIGRYYRDYIWTASTKEVTKDEMDKLLSEIADTLNGLSSSTGADRIYNYLGFSTAVCNLLYDQRNIMAATVEKAQVLAILDLVYEDLPDISMIQSDKTKEMAQTLTDNQQLYYDMITRAFERNGG